LLAETAPLDSVTGEPLQVSECRQYALAAQPGPGSRTAAHRIGDARQPRTPVTLHRCEREAILPAETLRADALLVDEQIGRTIALSRNIPLSGTLGVLERAGFAGLENGELLKQAEAAKFDVLLTVDRGFEYQQNLATRHLAVIVFCGESVLLEDLLPLMTTCLDHLKTIQPGHVISIGD